MNQNEAKDLATIARSYEEFVCLFIEGEGLGTYQSHWTIFETMRPSPNTLASLIGRLEIWEELEGRHCCLP